MVNVSFTQKERGYLNGSFESSNTTIEEAAKSAIKIQRAIQLSYYLVFNEVIILVDRPDTKESIIRKYRKRIGEEE